MVSPTVKNLAWNNTKGLAGYLPLIKRFAHDLKSFSPKQLNDFYDKYRESMDLTAGISSAKSFETYTQKRQQTALDFAVVKSADGQELKLEDGSVLNIGEKLKIDNDATIYIKEQIKGALELTAATKQAKAEFEKDLEAANALVQQNPPQFTPAALASYLLQRKGYAVDEIKQQHASELNNLEQLFQNQQFKENLKIGLKITDAQLDTVKQSMKSQLEGNHKNQLNDFENAINDNVNKLHNAAKNDAARISFLADRYHRDEAMRKKLDALIAQRQHKPDGPASMEYNFDEQKAIFRGIKVEDLEIINTTMGRSIVRQPDGSYAMALNRFFQSENSVNEDLTSLAQTLKACGYGAITMTLHAEDPKEADELGRKAFEACIRAGFPPDQIKINVNGQLKYDPSAQPLKNELFTEGHSTRLEKAKADAEEIKKQENLYTPPYKDKNQDEIKAESAHLKQAVHDHRAKLQAQQQQQQNQPAPNQP